jgi:hypothetical protein
VPEARVLAINEENEALRMKLRRESALTSSQGSKEKMTMPEVGSPAPLVECMLKGLLDQPAAALQVLDNILYLEEEAQEEMSQNWGDETKCTYAQGYVDQPVYSCRECSERTGKQVRERSHHCRMCLALLSLQALHLFTGG